MREPRSGDRPERRLVRGHLPQDFRFRSSVGEHVQEVDDHRHQRKRPVGVNTLHEMVALGDIEHLHVPRFHLQRGIDLRQLPVEKLMLVTVPTHIVIASRHPFRRVELRDIAGEEPAEDRVPSIGSGRWQDRVVVVLLDREQIAQQRQNGKPMVEAQAVHHHEENLSALLEQRRHELGHDVHREERRFLLVSHPRRVLPLDEFPELHVAVASKVFVHRAQAGVEEPVEL